MKRLQQIMLENLQCKASRLMSLSLTAQQRNRLTRNWNSCCMLRAAINHTISERRRSAWSDFE